MIDLDFIATFGQNCNWTQRQALARDVTMRFDSTPRSECEAPSAHLVRFESNLIGSYAIRRLRSMQVVFETKENIKRN